MSEQDDLDVVETSEPESAPEEKEKVTFSDEQQKVVENQLAAKAFEVRESKRQQADLQRQLDEAKAVPKEARPDVAAQGDIDDSDYETQRQQREEQIRKQATYDARAGWDAEAQQADQLAQQQKEQQTFNDSVAKFKGTASKFDIDPNALALMDQTIGSYGGLSPDVGSFIINDEQGMLIYRHMAENPQDIQTVNAMTPMQKGIFLTDIKTKQIALNTKKTSGAPDPADRPEGGGVDTDTLVYSKGVVYS